MPPPLPVFQRPLPDEWIGFYLQRLAARYQMSLSAFLDYAKLRPALPRFLNWRNFPGFPQEQLGDFCALSHLSTSEVHALQFRLAPLRNGGHLAYCPQCFHLDFLLGRPPFWRCSWSDGYTTCCLTHGVLLDPFPLLSGEIPNGLHCAEECLAGFAMRSANLRPDPAVLSLAYLVQPLLRLLHHDASTFPPQGASPALIELVDGLACLIQGRVNRPSLRAELADALDLAPQALTFGGYDPYAKAPMIARIVHPHHRAWLIACALVAIAPRQLHPAAAALTIPVRRFLVRALDVRCQCYHLGSLAERLQFAKRSKLIVPWPETERWLPEQQHRRWRKLYFNSRRRRKSTRTDTAINSSPHPWFTQEPDVDSVS